jgi:predicted MFS family arabinose efflux permease
MKALHWIGIFTFLLSFVNEAFRPANSTAVAYYSSPENRTRSYSLNRLAVNLGWAVGSALGGIIARYNYAWLFWLDGFTNLFAAFLMWRLLRDAGRRQKNQLTSKSHEQPVAERRESAYRDRPYLVFILLVAVFGACFFQLFSTVSVYMRQSLQFTEPFIGLLMATNGILIVLIEMVLVHHLEGRRNALLYISIGVALVALFYLFLGIGKINEWMAIVLILMITLGEIFAMPFMNSFWINRSKVYNRGEYAALYTMAWSAAQTLGPMLSAQLAELTSFRFTWWIVAGCAAVVAGSFWFLRNRLNPAVH